jgi:hypothetical protein
MVQEVESILIGLSHDVVDDPHSGRTFGRLSVTQNVVDARPCRQATAAA